MKAYKVELLIIDFDEVGESGIKSLLEDTSFPNRCINPSVMDMQSRDIGEWHDNHPLNFTTTSKSEFERLFKEQL